MGPLAVLSRNVLFERCDVGVGGLVSVNFYSDETVDPGSRLLGYLMEGGEMNLIMRLYDDFLGGRAAVGLLIFRLVTGLALMIHGWPKIQNPMGWMGDGAPAFLQLLAALAEFGGGLALVLGLLTPIACIGIACTMIGALALVHLPKGDVWIGRESFELPLSYLVSAILLFLTGPGKFSLDALIFGKRTTRGLADVERKERAVVG